MPRPRPRARPSRTRTALEKGHLVEAHRADLIGEHLGQTGVKTNKLIDSALGGVLFIDEAYGLHGGYRGNADAFGDEVLQVLLKRAEDDRHRLVVILFRQAVCFYFWLKPSTRLGNTSRTLHVVAESQSVTCGYPVD